MNFRLILATTAFALTLPFNIAHAAPQMLGLLADNALPLNCVDGTCTVEVSAICLQEERAMPAWGTIYKPVKASQVSISGTALDGSQISLPIGDIAKIESERGSWAVTISIPEAPVIARGLTNPALVLDGRVALTAIPEAGDRSPQTATEIAAAISAFEKSSKKIIGGNAAGMAAANVLNEMINTLPHVALEEGKAAGGLWQKTFRTTETEAPGMAQAAKYFQQCSHELLLLKRSTIRRCLEIGHDGFVTTVNQRYWDSTKPGV